MAPLARKATVQEREIRMRKTSMNTFFPRPVALAAGMALATGAACAQSWTAPGNYSYTVPVNVTSVQVDLAGAGGGGGGFDNNKAGAGGAGGALSATVKVMPGDVLAVAVGGGGQGATSNFGPRVAGVRQPNVPAPWRGEGGVGGSSGGAGGEPGNDGQGFSGGGGGGGGSSKVSFDEGSWAGRSFALQAGGGGGGSGDSVTGSATDGGAGLVGTAALTSVAQCANGHGAGGAGETIQGRQGQPGRAGTAIAKEDGGGGGGGGGGYPAGSGGLYGYDGDGSSYAGAFPATAGGGGGSCFYAATAGQVQVVAVALTGGAGGPAETKWPPATGFTRTRGGDGQVKITPLTGKIEVQLNAIANWPPAQTATLQFQATCGAQTYAGSFTYSGAAATAVIDGVPLNSNCTLAQTLPAPPAGFAWGTPVLPNAPIAVLPDAVPVMAVSNSLTPAAGGGAGGGVTAVPTLGEWALLFMGLGLAGVAAPALRRRG